MNKKIILSLIVFLLIAVIASTVLATENLNDLLAGNDVNNANENTQNFQQIDTDNNVTGNNTNNSNANTNNTPNTLAKTGIGDYSTIVMIVVFAVSAIYAYNKIRNYNV